jgi:hypothetical protein
VVLVEVLSGFNLENQSKELRNGSVV